MFSLGSLTSKSRIALLGFGKEGQSTLRFLQKKGYTNITILDQQEVLEKNLSITYITGEKYLDTLGDFEMIIKSPGISPYHEKIIPHRNKLYSQTQIFFENYEGKVIGITGTKGKSTVSSLTSEILKKLGYSVKLVGNIGSPVLQEIDVSEKKYDYIVYELSSYMLEGWSPKLFIGFVNNIFPCHLDWHKELSIYTRAKYNILGNAEHKITHSSLKGGDRTFPHTDSFHFQNGIFYKQDTALFDQTNIQIIGDHNKTNICGVLSILDLIETDTQKLTDTTKRVLKNFKALRHRLEDIGIYKGIRFIDDGAAVTPDATITAIEAMKNTQALLLGGKDIGMDQSTLEEKIIHSDINILVLFPETGYDIFREHTRNKKEESPFDFTLEGRTIQCVKTRSMETAVQFCFLHTTKGKSVLLSSAAQSYSLWKNFEEKGQQYQKYIKKYAAV